MSTNRPSALPRRNPNSYTNHPFGEVITKNHSTSSEISAIDCDGITLKYLPQILTEKKGGSLDVRKCFFIFEKSRIFDVQDFSHVTLPSYSGIW